MLCERMASFLSQGAYADRLPRSFFFNRDLRNRHPFSLVPLKHLTTLAQVLSFSGQWKPPDTDRPVFAPSAKVDYELEMVRPLLSISAHDCCPY